MEDHRINDTSLLLEVELALLQQTIIQAAKDDSPQIVDDSTGKVKPEVHQILTEMIRKFDLLQQATSPHHPLIYADTDVVMIIPGPGPVKKGLGESPDRYSDLDYTRKMNRARVRVAIALMLDVTKQRLEEKGINKTTSQITGEDVLALGPYLHYADPPERLPNFALALKEHYPQIPQEKVFMYDQIIDLTGRSRPIVNTSDQMHGLTLPDIPIRRIAVISDPAHLLRAMYQLGLTPNRIPNHTIVQAWPIPTPRSGTFDHTKRQLVGTIASIYKLGTASKQPYPYKL